jgi:hypothetical protein
MGDEEMTSKLQGILQFLRENDFSQVRVNTKKMQNKKNQKQRAAPMHSLLLSLVPTKSHCSRSPPHRTPLLPVYTTGGGEPRG